MPRPRYRKSVASVKRDGHLLDLPCAVFSVSLEQLRQRGAAPRCGRGPTSGESVRGPAPDRAPADVERHELRGEGLGGGDPDFRPGVRVHGAVGFPRGHAADDIADGNALGALLARLAKRRQRVGGLARLGDRRWPACSRRRWGRDSGTLSRNRLRPARPRAASMRYLPTRPACQDVPHATMATFLIDLSAASPSVDLFEEHAAGVERDTAQNRSRARREGCSKISFSMKCL